MDKSLEEDEEFSATQLHWLIAKKFCKKVSAQTIRRFLYTPEASLGSCQDENWPYDLRLKQNQEDEVC